MTRSHDATRWFVAQLIFAMAIFRARYVTRSVIRRIRSSSGLIDIGSFIGSRGTKSDEMRGYVHFFVSQALTKAGWHNAVMPLGDPAKLLSTYVPQHTAVVIGPEIFFRHAFDRELWNVICQQHETQHLDLAPEIPVKDAQESGVLDAAR